ncbi:hypothetical protein DL767_001358 [Monosporascus sp. MG133]|nr:hypothetical protein DL767_001358 [Monosporascus sp. MG133]
MSRSTPRKNRNIQGQQSNNFNSNNDNHQPSISSPNRNNSNNNNSNRPQYGHTRNNSSQRHLRPLDQVPVTSDYESDAAYYMDSQPPPASAALVNRTNTELNLSVLKRYLPSISHILSVAANAVVFTFSLDNMAWEKANIEGPMFVCSQGSAAADGEWGHDGGCVFVLNRKGLDNLILDLTTVSKHETQNDLLIFRVEEGSADDKVVGLWIHPETEETRPTNAALINQVWSSARTAKEQREAVGLGGGPQAAGTDVGPAMQAMGREVSVSALFVHQNGAGISAPHSLLEPGRLVCPAEYLHKTLTIEERRAIKKLMKFAEPWKAPLSVQRPKSCVTTQGEVERPRSSRQPDEISNREQPADGIQQLVRKLLERLHSDTGAKKTLNGPRGRQGVGGEDSIALLALPVLLLDGVEISLIQAQRHAISRHVEKHLV